MKSDVVPAHSKCRFCSGIQMLLLDIVPVYYIDHFLTDIPMRGLNLSPVYYMRKYNQLAALRSTIIKCDNDGDGFQCSRQYSRIVVSVLLEYVPILFKYIPYFVDKLYWNFLLISMKFFQMCTNTATWTVCCKMSLIHSPFWKVHCTSLQLSRNMYLRHDFRALYMNFLLKSRKEEELQHSMNFIFFLLNIGKYCVRWGFCTFLHRKRFRDRTFKYKSLNRFRNQRGPVPVPVPLSQTGHKLPKHRSDIGGHRARTFSFDVLEPYLTTPVPSQLEPSHIQFKFVDHVDDIGSLQYPKNKYAHTHMPLNILIASLSLTRAKKVVAAHGISAGARCTLADLQIRVTGHTCLVCNTHVSVFSAENNIAYTAMKRSQRNRETKTKAPSNTTQEFSNIQKDSSENATIEFPPPPVDSELAHRIIASACHKMDSSAIEESGCAICGELKPLKGMSKLKSVKNLLHILVSPGVTRKERKDDSLPVHQFSGPVLDYKCNKICDDCRKALRTNKIPKLALANNLWIGNVPEELKCLRFVEKILIARVRHTCSFVKVASEMRKMKANVVAFESPVPRIYEILPPPRDDLDDVLAILFTGPCKPSEADISRTPFLVRRNHVMRALRWLKANHCDYSNIEISTKNLEGYSEIEPPVSIQYRPSNTNKASEGTSVFDTEVEDGTEEGDCSFTVHGLTGENLDTMTTMAIKAQALRHLNNQGKFLLVGQSQKLESIWNNPQLYPQMFPWLFPYGLGGIGTTRLSDKEHKRHLLMYHDKRFQVDINFPFVAFSHEQTKASTTQSFLLVDQNRFGSITDRLLNIDHSVLADIVEKMAQGEHIKPETEAEKACFQVIRDLDHVAGKVHGSTTSKKYMRNQLWSLIGRKGAPYWYITLSPADIQHPLCIYFAQTNEEFKPSILPYDERLRLVCANPVAGARFFHFLVETFISDVLGVNSKHRGLYGDTDAYYGTVEQQGRLTLHLHILLWIKGGLSPQEMRRRLMGPDLQFQKKVTAWLESCFTGDFMTGSQEEVLTMVAENSKAPTYADPTQTMPEIPPPFCVGNHNDHCKPCSGLETWWNKFRITVDDILSRSNIHNCDRNTNKDGTRRKGASAGCMDNKWGKCKARFPRPTAPATTVDPETGYLTMKKFEAWINTITPIVTYLFRCNTDITSLSSGTAIKGVVLYISDYITKTSLKTHTVFESIKSVFHKNTEMINGTLPMKEKARRIMTKVVNLLSAKMEMGAPMICMYLLGNPDHYTDHKFIPFYWQSFVSEAQSAFAVENQERPNKVALVRKQGRIVGISPVFDYTYRAPELYHLSLYEWVTRCKRIKILTSGKEVKEENPVVNIDVSFEAQNESFQNADTSITEEATNVGEIPADFDNFDNDISNRKLGKNVYLFLTDHPLSDSHALRLVPENEKIIPDFVGATLPRCDQGDREWYCSTMLVLFHPWRTGKDLKLELETWDDAFTKYAFNELQKQLMNNFNIRYECLDARDDYRAQMKRGSAPSLPSSWDPYTNDNYLDLESKDTYEDPGVDDIPINLLKVGKGQYNRLMQMETMSHILRNTGWTDERPIETNVYPTFTPGRVLAGSEWKAEVVKKRREIQDTRNVSNQPKKAEGPNQQISRSQENIVKVVDKSYLEKKFHSKEFQFQIEESVEKYSLNEEQERAFRIVANHAVSPCSEQLKMYIGGMGGTGKSQVLKALSHFFAGRKEAHRFVVVAPTGAAAALLGGSTYHYLFGINEYSSKANLSQVRGRLAGVEYVFLDEVSMLSARDLYKISFQLCKVFNIPEIPFGNLNMVFSGDFSQLPPALGGENVSLYSRVIGAISSNKKSQEEAIGKALWHQVTTVVILRQNMRQKTQSAEDAKFRQCLENLRYKSCTTEDINFCRSLISAQIPGRPSISDDNFRNISIITARNIHKDEINRLGAIRFASETGQTLVDFYSDDSAKTNTKNDSTGKRARHVGTITEEIQQSLWSQPPASTDNLIAGKLSLCIGLPVMIQANFATELCITKGQEGHVYGWQSAKGTKGQRVLDTLFVKLANPPSDVQFEGLPENVVPLTRSSTTIKASLPNDNIIFISRSQVEVLVNFSMTDFASQGKTRPQNPVDLNNLQTHQAYYTALSRSSSAKGTIILQGFDPRKMTGGASGALRQELRELELLDEMTRLHYLGKLHKSVSGVTRNQFIKGFREWKGCQYVPQNVHKSIRWTKQDPLDEGEIEEVKWKIIQHEKIVAKGLNIEQSLPASHTSNPLKQKISMKDFKHNEEDADREPANKKTCLGFDNNVRPHRTLVPLGLQWMQNSCAYDASFVILYSLYSRNVTRWTEQLEAFQNSALNNISEGFQKIQRGQKTFEQVRDHIRRALELEDYNNFRFGRYTSLITLWEHILQAPHAIRKSYYQCQNGHIDRVRYGNSGAYSVGVNLHGYTSLSQWMSPQPENSPRCCPYCTEELTFYQKFVSAPPLVALEFAGHPIEIDNQISIKIENLEYSYNLVGIVYYGSEHFTARIILEDGQIWFHDGVTTMQTSQYDGSLALNCPELYMCRGRRASLALYSVY